MAPGPIRVARPSKTLRELTLEQMRTAILDVHFKPGERLVERDLCLQLGVSRTVVREVLRHLESEGLVSILPGRGPIVAETSPDEAWQIYEIRETLEGVAAGACAEKADAAAIAGLDGALEAIRRAYTADDQPGVLAATTEFYRVMFAAAGREIAWGIVSSLTVRINHLRSMTIKTKGRQVGGPEEMQLIVEAIRRGDAEGATVAARAHVARAAAIARNVLEPSLK